MIEDIPSEFWFSMMLFAAAFAAGFELAGWHERQ
jgi:hypothetical protein